MSDDIWSQKTEYYDDGVKFGTGPEMITEIKSLSRKLEEARGRIAELNSVIEQKNWQIDNLVEFENVNGEKQSAAELLAAKDARIAELEAAIKPFAEYADKFANGPIAEIHLEDFNRARSTLEGKSDA